MTHSQRLTNTSASQNDVQCLLGQTTFGNLVKNINIECNLLFNTMVEVESFIRIINVVMTNVIIKRNCQRIGQ